LGFYNIPTSFISLKKKTLREKQQSSNKLSSKTPKHGDILISNHTSYIDILYFYTFYRPVFTHVSLSGKLRHISFFEALSYASQPPLPNDSRDTLTLAQLSQHAAKNHLGPVLVFPEATTTNGRGLLRPLPVLGKNHVEGLGAARRVFVVGLKYDFEDFSPYTVGGSTGLVWHVICLGAQFVNRLEVCLYFLFISFFFLLLN
jgi:1-acylglycerol-3-phosphate O-acyltransferase